MNLRKGVLLKTKPIMLLGVYAKEQHQHSIKYIL